MCAGRECGTYALAMTMATHKENTGSPDWSPGTLERRYYDALEALQAQYIGYEGDSYLLSDGDLVDIIRCWSKRYRDKYQLYIDDYDDIDTCDELDPSAKVILVRCINGRWEACCYFEDTGSNTGGSAGDHFTANRIHIHSPADTKQAQAQEDTAHLDFKTLDDNADSHSEVANIILSTISKFDTAIKELSAAMKSLAVVLKQRPLAALEQTRAMKDLSAAREKMIASMAELIQDPSTNVANDSAFVTLSEDDLTPSTQTLSDVSSTGFPW